MPLDMMVSMTVAEERYDNVHLIWGQGPRDGEGGNWMVELPAVLRMLRAAERGDIDAATIHKALLGATALWSKRSGCCPDCDDAIDSYTAAITEYEAAIAAERARQAAMTPESHPFIVSGSAKVHSWNCRTHPDQRTIEHPGRTLQEYVHQGRAFDGSGYDLRVTGSSTRMTADELTEWLRNRTPTRCKLCEPALPGSYRSETSGVETAGRR